MRCRSETGLRDRLKWRMTSGAACTRLRIRDPYGFANPRGTGIKQDRKRVGMKIFLRPDDVLVALFPGTAVTRRRFATDRTDKLRRIFAGLCWLLRENCDGPNRSQEKTGRAAHASEINIPLVKSSTLFAKHSRHGQAAAESPD